MFPEPECWLGKCATWPQRRRLRAAAGGWAGTGAWDGEPGTSGRGRSRGGRTVQSHGGAGTRCSPMEGRARARAVPTKERPLTGVCAPLQALQLPGSPPPGPGAALSFFWCWKVESRSRETKIFPGSLYLLIFQFLAALCAREEASSRIFGRKLRRGWGCTRVVGSGAGREEVSKGRGRSGGSGPGPPIPALRPGGILTAVGRAGRTLQRS